MLKLRVAREHTERGLPGNLTPGSNGSSKAVSLEQLGDRVPMRPIVMYHPMYTSSTAILSHRP
jgi:hypothetical protein